MHPSESSLALYAGDDLALWPRWRISRHIRGCETCRRQIEELHGVRDWMREQDGEMPAGVDWDTLAIEMRANIRVGLAAGQCVAEPRQSTLRWQPAMALPLLLIVLAGWLIQSWPRTVTMPAQAQFASVSADPVLDATQAGIGVEQDGRALRLLHPRAEGALYTESGPDSVRSRYVDAETNYVTISHVYAQ